MKNELKIMFNELNVEISVDEVQKAVKQLQNGKARGPDLLLNGFFKFGSQNHHKVILCLCIEKEIQKNRVIT